MPALGAEPDDWDLLNQGTSDALQLLFQRHKDFVYRLALSRLGSVASAEDVTQDVFLRLLGNRKTHQRRAKFSTWLYRVTSNVVIDRLRRRGRLVALSDAHEDPGRCEPYEARITLDRAIGLLQQLPTRQREAVLLREFEGMSTAEAAEMMQISTGSVKTHLHRGLARLRELLDPSHNQ